MIKKVWGVFIFAIIMLRSQAQVDTSFGSFYMVYSKVFSVSCALPACHDGSFEPDFRTSQSSYYTIINHPVKKNNSDRSFVYRVYPFSAPKSLLYERITNSCFVNEHDRMPLLSRDTLSQRDINLIENWISKGARDLCGDLPFLNN